MADFVKYSVSHLHKQSQMSQQLFQHQSLLFYRPFQLQYHNHLCDTDALD